MSPRLRPRRSWLPEPNYRLIFLIKSIGLAAGAAIGWLVFLFLAPNVQALPFTIVTSAALIPSLAVAFIRGRPPSSLLWLTLVLDVLTVTAGIHFAGGLTNVSGPMIYLIYIGLAGLLLSDRGAIIIAVLCGLSYALMGWAESVGILLSHPLPPDYSPLARVAMVNTVVLVGAVVGSFTTQQMRRLYQRAEDLRTEAVSAMSHDLKNPLSVVSGCVTLLRDDVPEPSRRYLDMIERAAQQATDVVRNVLDVATIDDSGFSIAHEPVQLGDVVRQSVDMHQFAAQSKAMRVGCDIAPDLPVIHGDAHLLARATGNLISNAIKYTPNGGTVEVNVRQEGKHLVLAVRDSGPGIAANEHTLLFQRFGRTGSSHRVEGTGLGLYIVRRVAEVHRGSVAVDSAAGSGSTFRIAIPID